MQDFATALALAFVIEGSLYTLFPEAVRRMAGQMTTLPVAALRLTGLAAASLGVAAVRPIRR